MKLRTGISLWTDQSSSPSRFAPPEGDLSCEVAIVGAGITGVLIGALLCEVGIDVILLDKRQPAAGSTAASTGLLQYELDTPLCDLIRQVGEARAVHAYRRGVAAIDQLQERVERLGVDCGFTRRESLYFASSRWHLRQLRKEFECRCKYGFDVKFLNRDQLAEFTSIDSPGAILSRSDGQINPLEFTRQVLAAAVARGLRVFGETPVDAWQETALGVDLLTPTAQVRARAMVVATGYEAHRQLDSSPGDLQSTYAVASTPLAEFSGWPRSCLIWETARPYFYARQTDDGRAIIGGADTAFSTDHADPQQLEKKSAELVARFQTLFPQIDFQPDYCWAGTFAETKDGLAYIGRLPGRERVYAALGYGGNGITFSAIAAPLVCDLYRGRANADESVFAFDR